MKIEKSSILYRALLLLLTAELSGAVFAGEVDTPETTPAKTETQPITNVKKPAPKKKAKKKTKKKTETKKKAPAKKQSGQKDLKQIVQAVQKAHPTVKSPHKKRSSEWQNLPKQSWETFSVEAQKDPLPLLSLEGIERYKSGNALGFDLRAFISTGRLDTLGFIIGSNSSAAYLSLDDIIYIEPEGDLKIGETYAITEDPTRLQSPKSGRKAFSYLMKGKVKILNTRDNLFTGRVLQVNDFVPRGSPLITLPARIQGLEPTAGPKIVEGTLVFDHRFSTFNSAQHKEVFIDRGSEDGIAPGMVFRAYKHNDPSNDKKLTASNHLIDADVLVTQVTNNYSAGLITRSNNLLSEFSRVTLVTDQEDLNKYQVFNEKKDGIEDELDQLEKENLSSSLTEEEKKKLKQLERWKENPTKKAVHSDSFDLQAPKGNSPTPPPESGTLSIQPGPEPVLEDPPTIPQPADPLSEGSPSTTTPPHNNIESSLDEPMNMDNPPLLEDPAPIPTQ